MIQFSICTHFSSTWAMDSIMSGATTPDQSRLGSDDNEGALCIPQSSNITETLPSDCLVSYLGHSSVGRSYPSAEMLSVYSTAPVEWIISFQSASGVIISIRYEMG